MSCFLQTPTPSKGPCHKTAADFLVAKLWHGLKITHFSYTLDCSFQFCLLKSVGGSKVSSLDLAQKPRKQGKLGFPVLGSKASLGFEEQGAELREIESLGSGQSGVRHWAWKDPAYRTCVHARGGRHREDPSLVSLRSPPGLLTFLPRMA